MHSVNMDLKIDQESLRHFHNACLQDTLEKIIMYVQQGFPINSHADSSFEDFVSYTPLHFAVKNKNKDAIIYLLEHGADITEKSAECWTPVHLAFYKFSDDLVFTIFKHSNTLKTYFDTVDKIGLSHFHICCALNVPVIEKFIKHGVRVDCSISLLADYYYSGFTPLHFAIEKGHTSIIKLLFEKYPNPNITCKGGLTPLHLACKVSDLSIIKLLLTFNTDLKSKDDNGCTPLHIAVTERRSIDIILYLLKKGASIHDQNHENKTPLELALKSKQYEIALAMLSSSNIQDVNLFQFFNFDDFHVACDEDNLHAIQMFVQFGFPVNSHASSNFKVEFRGYTPLHFALKNENLNAIIYLLENGADITEKCDKGWTPIHLAYYTLSEDFMPPIFDHSKINTYVDVADERGLTHFHICCALNVPVIEEFIVSEANVNSSISQPIQNDSGFTPLHFAVKKGHTSIVRLLLENGADHHLACEGGLTPLHMACDLGEILSVEILLDYGADVTIRDDKNRTPVHYAFCEAKNTAITSLFLSRIPQYLITEALGNDAVNVR